MVTFIARRSEIARRYYERHREDILARLKAEGSASPADVILLVDASRLWRAEVDRNIERRGLAPAFLRGETGHPVE